MRKLVTVMLVTSVLLVACKSKKKVVERNKTEVQTEKQVKTFKETQTELSVDSFTVEKISSVEIKNDEFIEVEAAKDTVSVEKVGKKLIITGADKITIGKTENKKNENKTLSTTITEQVRVTTNESEKTQENTSKTQKTTKRDVSTKGIPTGVVIGFFLILFIVFLLLLLRWYIKNFRFPRF